MRYHDRTELKRGGVPVAKLNLNEIRDELKRIVDSTETKPAGKRKRISIPEFSFDSATRPTFIYCREKDYKKF